MSSPPIARRLRDRIQREGPIPWRDFMQAALYDPEHGFYAQGRHPAGLGKGTHFATSPTLHPFFAQSIARELADAWKAAGQPKTWNVVEFGAGTGALAKDAMTHFRGLGVPATWTAIDVRPGPDIKGVEWQAKPPAQYDAVVANEFLDALPFDVLEWHDDAWSELGVTIQGEGFAWTHLAPASVQPPPGEDEGQRLVRMPANQPWLAGVSAAQPKVGLIIDYGALGPARDVRAFRGHDFTDPLAEPGSVDLTADVDFQELALQAVDLGFTVQVESQEQFLIRHGALTAINKIDRNTREGTSSYLRMRQLILPTGFGSAFKVARLTR